MATATRGASWSCGAVTAAPGLTVWYSYDQPVGFTADGVTAFTARQFGTTTARHIRALFRESPGAVVLTHAAFTAALDAALARHGATLPAVDYGRNGRTGRLWNGADFTTDTTERAPGHGVAILDALPAA